MTTQLTQKDPQQIAREAREKIEVIEGFDRGSVKARQEADGIILSAIERVKGNRRLSSAQVQEIRSSSESCRVLSERFGVGKSQIANIKKGTKWINP